MRVGSKGDVVIKVEHSSESRPPPLHWRLPAEGAVRPGACVLWRGKRFPGEGGASGGARGHRVSWPGRPSLCTCPPRDAPSAALRAPRLGRRRHGPPSRHPGLAATASTAARAPAMPPALRFAQRTSRLRSALWPPAAPGSLLVRLWLSAHGR